MESSSGQKVRSHILIELLGEVQENGNCEMRICIIFGHHNTQNSFNAAVRDTFIDEAKKNGHDIDLINLFKGKSNAVIIIFEIFFKIV